MINKINKLNVGRILKERRAELRLTCSDVEKLTGISKSYVSNIENGRHHYTSFAHIVALCFAYNISLDGLVIKSKLMADQEAGKDEVVH